MPTMLYKPDGPHEIDGRKVSYIIVEDDQIEPCLAIGWALTVEDAHKAEPEKKKAKK